MFINKESNSIFLIQKLNRTKKILDSDPINLSDLKREFESFEKLKQEENYNYLEDLLDPINRKGVKIPSKLPTATCSFQLKSTFDIETNNSGLAEVFFNPYFLYDKNITGKAFTYSFYNTQMVEVVKDYYWGPFLTTCGVLSRNSNQNGYSPVVEAYDFSPVNAGQGIPNIYSNYRLVSACMDVTYRGTIEEVSGLLGGVILQEKINAVGGKVQVNAGQPYNPSGTISSAYFGYIDRLSDLNTIKKNIYSYETSPLNGIRMLYFPIDNSYEEFKPLYNGQNVSGNPERVTRYNNACVVVSPNYLQSGFNFVAYLFGGKPRTVCLNVLLYLNFECTVNPKFLNYIPVSVNVWKIPKWKISELAKTMEKHAVTAIKKMSGIDFFVA